MAMYGGIFIGDYEKNMDLKEHHSGARISQMELLRTKCVRFCGILQSIVKSKLKFDYQILLLLIKPRRRLRLYKLPYLQM